MKSNLFSPHLYNREGIKTQWVANISILRCKRRRIRFVEGSWPHRRSSSERQVLADYFLSLSQNDSQNSSCKSSSGTSSSRRLAAGSCRQRPKCSRNSFTWTILQGTSLLSRFYSATPPVTPRKQGICVQNRGGGTPVFSRSLIQGPETAIKLEAGATSWKLFAISASTSAIAASA